jgi:hypothetical protein
MLFFDTTTKGLNCAKIMAQSGGPGELHYKVEGYCTNIYYFGNED